MAHLQFNLAKFFLCNAGSAALLSSDSSNAATFLSWISSLTRSKGQSYAAICSKLHYRDINRADHWRAQSFVYYLDDDSFWFWKSYWVWTYPCPCWSLALFKAYLGWSAVLAAPAVPALRTSCILLFLYYKHIIKSRDIKILWHRFIVYSSPTGASPFSAQRSPRHGRCICILLWTICIYAYRRFWKIPTALSEAIL